MPTPVIVRDPQVLGGIPCFRDTRVPFQNLLDYLEAGDTLDEFLEAVSNRHLRNGCRGARDCQRVTAGEDWVKILLDGCLPKESVDGDDVKSAIAASRVNQMLTGSLRRFQWNGRLRSALPLERRGSGECI